MRTAVTLRAGALLALPLLSGCYSYRATAYTDLHAREFVHIVADSGFVMQAQRFTGPGQTETCRLSRAEGTLLRVSADTVWLSPIAHALPVAGEQSLCQRIAAGFVTRNAGVDLRILSSRVEVRRTRTTILWSVVLGAFLAWFIDDYLDQPPTFSP